VLFLPVPPDPDQVRCERGGSQFGGRVVVVIVGVVIIIVIVVRSGGVIGGVAGQ
jgi:hypothetical protein